MTLHSLQITDDRIELEIEPQDNAEYRIEFVGTRQDARLDPVEEFERRHGHRGNHEHGHRTIHRYSEQIGEVLETVQGTRATYRVKGDELYVRARITSTRRHVNPFPPGDFEMAWTQPLVVKANESQR